MRSALKLGTLQVVHDAAACIADCMLASLRTQFAIYYGLAELSVKNAAWRLMKDGENAVLSALPVV